MEEISDICSRLRLGSDEWYDNSEFGLYVHDARVFTRVNIRQGQFIGYIVGTTKYIWDVIPDSYYVPINDMQCIDCNQLPRCITSMIKKDTSMYNCIIAYSYNDYSVDAYIISTIPIYANNELICKYEYSENTIFDNC